MIIGFLVIIINQYRFIQSPSKTKKKSSLTTYNENKNKQIKHQDYLNKIINQCSQCYKNIKNVDIKTTNGNTHTLNKNTILINVFDKRTNTFFSSNTIMYVLLHEYAHILCSDFGHTQQFFTIFIQLVEGAVKCGILDLSLDVNYPDNI